MRRSIRTEPEGFVSSLAWSPDSSLLCLGIEREPLPRLYDAISGEKLTTLTAPDVSGVDPIVGWSPDGRLLAAASGKQVRIWDAETRKHLRNFDLEQDAISLVWHKDSRLLAIVPSTGGGGAPFVLDTTNGEIAVRAQTKNAFDSDWSPDGTELVIHSYGALRFIDGKTGKERAKA